MITLFSYPPLCGVADNNGYGLKIFAYLKLCGLPFTHAHVFDASAAPRGQLPYITDGEAVIGDSAGIIAHLEARHGATLDAALSQEARDRDLLIHRLLDDLYWVISYSRWKDDRFYPAFRDIFLHAHPSLTEAALDQARAFNFQRYHFQGIGRYAPEAAYARGVANLAVLARLVREEEFVHGAAPRGIDAAIYGFVANIQFYPIETPLKGFLAEAPDLVRHCMAIHERVSG